MKCTSKRKINDQSNTERQEESPNTEYKLGFCVIGSERELQSAGPAQVGGVGSKDQPSPGKRALNPQRGHESFGSPQLKHETKPFFGPPVSTSFWKETGHAFKNRCCLSFWSFPKEGQDMGSCHLESLLASSRSNTRTPGRTGSPSS